MKTCGKCGRSYPDNWSVPFSLIALSAVPGLREMSKRGEICKDCHRDQNGVRRPTPEEMRLAQKR